MNNGRRRGTRISPDIRRAIQQSQDSVQSIAERYDLNPKTVRRWRGRASTEAAKPGPKRGSSTAFTLVDEVLVVSVRRFFMLPLDDCHYVLQAFIPGLTRASLHRCLRKHGHSRLPDVAPHSREIGTFDLHLLEIGTDECDRVLLIGVEQTSKFVHALVSEARRGDAVRDFIEALDQASPVGLRRLCIERGSAIAALHREITATCARKAYSCRIATSAWPRDQIDRMRALVRQEFGTPAANNATDVVHERILQFIKIYNRRSKLKSIGGKTPYELLRADRRCKTGEAGLSLATVDSGFEDNFRDTRERVLYCARSLLSTAGADGVSLSQVAKMAGLNRGTIYHYFKSRGQLLTAVNEWSSEQLCQAIFAEAQGGPDLIGGEINILDVVRKLSDFAMRNPTMCQAWLLQMLASRDPSNDKFWREYLRRSVQFHETPKAQENINAEVLSVILLAGSFLWPLWARTKSDDDTHQRAQVDQFVHEVCRLALNGTVKRKFFPEVSSELAKVFAGTA